MACIICYILSLGLNSISSPFFPPGTWSPLSIFRTVRAVLINTSKQQQQQKRFALLWRKKNCASARRRRSRRLALRPTINILYCAAVFAVSTMAPTNQCLLFTRGFSFRDWGGCQEPYKPLCLLSIKNCFPVRRKNISPGTSRIGDDLGILKTCGCHSWYELLYLIIVW